MTTKRDRDRDIPKLPKLVGRDDYFDWSEAFKRRVMFKNPKLWSVIIGVYPFKSPTDTTQSTDQRHADDLLKWQAKAWLEEACLYEPLQSIKPIENPADAWHLLKKTYAGYHLMNWMKVSAKLAELHQTGKFEDFIEQIGQLLEKLTRMRHPPSSERKLEVFMQGISSELMTYAHNFHRDWVRITFENEEIMKAEDQSEVSAVTAAIKAEAQLSKLYTDLVNHVRVYAGTLDFCEEPVKTTEKALAVADGDAVRVRPGLRAVGSGPQAGLLGFRSHGLRTTIISAAPHRAPTVM